MKKLVRWIVSIIFLCLVYKDALAQVPVANFTVVSDSGCSPFLVQFNNTSTGSPTSYQWNFGDGSGISTLTNPQHTYSAPGSYTVSLTAINGQGSNIKTVVGAVVVLGVPTVNFSANITSGCSPLTVTFTDNSNPILSGPATYQWGFGNGSTAATQHATYTFTIPGIYPITHTVTNSGGCVTSLVKNQYITVHTPPVADFTFANICKANSNTTFTTSVSGNGPYTYNWDFGDGTNGTANNPTHVYAIAGSYNVRLIVTDVNGCKDTVIKTVSVGTLKADFTSPTNVCVSSPVLFSNTSAGAAYYVWDFGDGSPTVSTTNPVHIYSNVGNYTVTLYATDVANLCTDTFSRTISVKTGPNASFAMSPAIPCSKADTIFFTNTSTGGVVASYWNFGDGDTSTAMNPKHVYTFNRVYVVSLTVTDTLGCKTTIIVSKPIYKVVVDITKQADSGYCLPATIKFNTSLYGIYDSVGAIPFNIPATITNIIWDFGDGSPTTTSFSPTHTYTNQGTYTVSISGVTSNGCLFTDTSHVTVANKPTAFFTANKDTICAKDSVYFTNLSTNGLNYVWYLYQYPDWIPDDYSTAANPNIAIKFNYPRTYYVTLVALNGTCADTFTLPYPIVVLPPNADFGYVVSCDTPGLVRFFDTSFGGVVSRLWDFGDGHFDTSKYPTHQYLTQSSFTVKLTVYTNGPKCTTDVMVRQIDFTPIVSDFFVSDTLVCVGDTIWLRDTFSGSVTDVRHYINWPSNLNISLPYHIYSQGGVYTMAMVFKNGVGCKDTSGKYNVIRVGQPLPTLLAVPSKGCAPFTTNLIENNVNTPGVANVKWHWLFGDGQMDSSLVPSKLHVYSNPGLYSVKVWVTDTIGCTDSAERLQYIDVHKMFARFVADDTTACVNQTIIFSSNGSYTIPSGISHTYYWNFGDGSAPSTLPNPTHTYSQPGTYTVVFAITDSLGCTDTLVRTNYIHVQDVQAAFTASDTYTLCPPLSVQFTNNSINAAQNNWDFGDGAHSIIPSPMNIYTHSGLYTVRLIVTNSYGCKDTAWGTINVLGYAGLLNYTPLVGCNPMYVNFSAVLTNIHDFKWDFSDGTVVNGTSSSTNHTYTSPGKYIPKILFSDSSGCLNSSIGKDTIYVDEVFAQFTTTPLCVNSAIQFRDTSWGYFSAAKSWIWDFNNGQYSSNSKTPTAYFPTAGTIPVVLIVTNANGCKDTVHSNVTVHDLPSIKALYDTVICLGDSALLRGHGGVQYTWQPVSTLTCPTCSTTMAHPITTTNYYLTGTDTNGCQNKDTVQVAIKTKTSSVVGPGGDICADSSLQLWATGAQRYEWSPATGLDNDRISNPIAQPTTTTTYMVKAFEGSCAPDSHYVKVVVHPLPTVNAGIDETIVAGNSVNLNAKGSGIATYAWSPIASLSCSTCSSPVARPMATTNYVVQVRSDWGCVASDTVTIHVLCDQSQLFIPNTFSPNGDGENEVFYPRGVGLREVTSFRVFNRWGELMFERKGILLNDAKSGWDGTYKGNALSPDVFVYVLEGICEEGGKMIWKGDINLIR